MRNELNDDTVFLGIDAGTTVIKSVLFDASGREVGVAQATVPLEAPQSGWQEEDMHSVWAAARETIGKVLHQTDISPARIRAVAVTGQGGGCWLIDGNGNPVRNAITWLDGRAAGIVSEWEQSGQAEEMYKICGSIQYSGLQSAIIRWLALHEPETLKAARHTLWCKDWIKLKLTGKVATDPSEAGISFLDIRTLEYNSELLQLMGIEQYQDLLPPVQGCNEITGTLAPSVAEELGLPEDLVVVGSAFDMMSTAIGVGAVSDGDACSILSTSWTNEVVLEKPEIEPLNVGFTICHGVPDHWVRAMAGMVGTPNLDWFIANFCHQDKAAAEQAGDDIFAHLEKAASQIPVGSGGIIYHSYLSPAGERSPFVNENVKAQFVGLSQDHTRHHLLRAVYEGVALASRHAYESIPVAIERVSLSGGGSRSALWCQILADTLNAEVRVPTGTELGAKGAVINAMVVLGIYDSHAQAVEQAVEFEKAYYPDADNHSRYSDLYQIYLRTFESMLGLWDDLARFRKAM